MVAGLAAVVTGAGVLGTASPASAAPLTFTVTREGHTVNLYRFAVSRTPVTGTGATRADFDGDGRDDVAATANGDGQGSFPDTDLVVVRYSSSPFDDLVAGQFANGCWGRQLVAGDFDGDGFDDLVISASCEPDSATDLTPAGGVWVVPGSASGLRLDRTVHVDQDTPGVPGTSESGDAFGWALAAGDLTGDGRDELAVGNATEDVGTVRDAGTVTVLRGSATGLTTSGALALDQNLPWVPGTAERGDQFGSGLAIGRVDRGANADLVVGARDENGTGMVTLLRGAAGGLATSGASSVLADAASAAASTGTATTTFNAFGMRVAVGDTTGDGLGEVVLGVPGTGFATTTTGFLSAGAVVVLAGRTTGLSTAGMRVIHQDTAGVPGTRETSDGWGFAVAVGDATGDGRADVLVGTPDEGAGGSVTLLLGRSTGVSGTGARAWSQASPGVPGTGEPGDAFGAGVTLLDLDGRGPLDVVVTAPGETLATDTPPTVAGAVTTFTGGSAGLTPGTSWTGAAFRTPEFFVSDYAASVVGRESAV